LETELYLGSLALLGLALYQNAKYIARSPACRIYKQATEKSNEPEGKQVDKNK
jgi:hypothetical protein